jgi:hypothetical protein
MKNDLLEGSNRPRFLGRIFGTEQDDYLARSSQVHILREELHLGVLPIGGRSRNHQNFDIELIGQDLEAAMSTLSSLERVNQQNIKESVCDVVNSLALDLTYSGFIRYEIVEQEGGGSLHYIPERCFYDLGIAGVQVIPRQQRKQVKKAITVRAKKHIWKLTFPKKICSWKRYRRILGALAKNTSLIPSQIDPNELYESSLGFDMSFYNKESKKYIYSILNDIGGAQRETSLENITRFYLVNRMIRLNLSKVLIREHIVDEINQLFRKLRIDSKVIIMGLPSSDDVNGLLSELQDGNTGIDEALAKINIY